MPATPPTDDPMRWTVEGTDPVADCRVFEVQARRSRRDDGVEGTFYTVQSPDWVNVIAVTDDDRVVLIRQWRHGAATGVLEIPGGMVDAGEDPLTAARRELAEETGYASERWTKLGEVNPNPALFDNRLYSYLAEGCTRTAEAEPDAHEQVVVDLVDRAAVDELLRAGKIDHALVMAAFQWWYLRGP